MGALAFDFAGTYTKIVPLELNRVFLWRPFRRSRVSPQAKGVTVRVTFDAETTHSEEQQRQGWQAILNNFSRYVRIAPVKHRLFWNRGRCAALTAAHAGKRRHCAVRHAARWRNSSLRFFPV